jgi:hypothetical protein
MEVFVGWSWTRQLRLGRPGEGEGGWEGEGRRMRTRRHSGATLVHRTMGRWAAKPLCCLDVRAQLPVGALLQSRPCLDDQLGMANSVQCHLEYCSIFVF